MTKLTDKTVLFLAISLSTIPSLANLAEAAVIKSNFQLNSSLAKTKQFIVDGFASDNLKSSDNVTIPDFSVTDPVKVEVSGIHLTLNSEFLPPIYTEQSDEVKMKSKAISANLQVDRIDVHEVYYVGDGSNRLKVLLDGVCKDVKLTLPESKSTKVDARLKINFVGGRPKLSIVDFVASWEEGTWQVVSMNCEGPKGFDNQIKIAAEEKLKTIDPFKDSIREKLQASLIGLGDKPIRFKADVNYDGQPVTLFMNLDRVTQLDPNFISTTGVGEFEFGGSKARDQDCDADLTDKPIKDTGYETKGNFLYFPYATARALMNCAFKNGNMKFTFLSSDIGPFQELRKNRQNVSVVWPDLANWDDKDFKFEAELLARPTLTRESFDSDLTMSAIMTAPLKATMFLPKKYYFIPYMHFSTQLSGLVNFSMRDGKLWIAADKKFKPDIEWTWDSTYIERYAPNPYVWWAKIQESIQERMVKPGFSMALPTLDAFGKAKDQIHFTSGDFLGSTVRMSFEFVKK